MVGFLEVIPLHQLCLRLGLRTDGHVRGHEQFFVECLLGHGQSDTGTLEKILCQSGRLFRKLVQRDHPVDQADLGGLFRVDESSGQKQFACNAETDQAGQEVIKVEQQYLEGAITNGER